MYVPSTTIEAYRTAEIKNKFNDLLLVYVSYTLNNTCIFMLDHLLRMAFSEKYGTSILIYNEHQF